MILKKEVFLSKEVSKYPKSVVYIMKRRGKSGSRMDGKN
jgi:hypothetical protein